MNARLSILAPFAIFVLVMVISGTLWFASYRLELRQIENETRIITEQIGFRIDSWIHDRTTTLNHLIKDLDLVLDPDLEEFLKHVKAHTELVPGYQAINWVNSQGIIEVIFPITGNEAALGKNLYDHPTPSVPQTINKAIQTQRVARTPATIELFQGGRGFALYWPVYDSKEDLLGFVNGVFKVDELVRYCLNDDIVNPERFHYRLSESDSATVFDSILGYTDELLPPFSSPHKSNATVDVADRTWLLEVEPIPEILPGASFANYDYIIPTGLILACVLAWMTFIIVRKNDQLHLTTKRYLDLYENAPVAYFSIGLDKKIHRANRSACSMLGYSKEELTDRSVIELYADTPNGKQKALRAFEKSLLGDGIQGEELEMVCADGSIISIVLSVTWVKGLNGKIIESRSSIMDITEQVRAREKQVLQNERLHQSRKMESLGVLAGGIAHDFNNLLMIIMGNTELIRKQLPEDAEVQSCGEDIIIASHKAAKLCNQMLMYAGKVPLEFKPIDVNEIIKGMQRIFEPQTQPQIILEYKLTKNVPDIMADISQIQQCILDMMTNAMEALEDQSGNITLSTKIRQTPVPEGTEIQILASEQDGPFVAICVADTGPGVNNDQLPKMFEPFSSTKFMGRGLGLSSLHGIVRRHNGAILVRSREGHGMNIEILFPVSIPATS